MRCPVVSNGMLFNLQTALIKCQCSRLQAGSDGGRALHRFPPRQPLVAADKRFVSGRFAATSITICQMLCGRSAKAGAILLLFLCCLGRSCRHVVVPKMLTQKANGSLVFRLSDSSNWPY
jgi:hypothetical protein